MLKSSEITIRFSHKKRLRMLKWNSEKGAPDICCFFKYVISKFFCASVSKRVLCKTIQYENEFWMQFHFHANQSVIFIRKVSHLERQKGTRKWPRTCLHVICISPFFFMLSLLGHGKMSTPLVVGRLSTDLSLQSHAEVQDSMVQSLL